MKSNQRPTSIQPLKGWWLVSYSNGIVANWSLSRTRSGAIRAFIEDSVFDWSKDAKKNGWHVGKVNVDFTLI